MAFPADTTNIFPAFDFLFFGALKKLKATTQGEFGDDSLEPQIGRLVQAYHQIAMSTTIRGSFHKAGLVRHTSVCSFKLAFEEGRIRGKEGFREIWDRKVNIEEFSRR